VVTASPATLGTIARTLVAGDAVTTWLSPQGNSVDVSVRLPKELKTNASQLMQIPLNNPRAPDGEALALERVAMVSESANPKIIERSNLQRQITVSAGVSGKTQGEVGSEVNKILKTFELPPGYRFDQGGDNQMMAESFGYALLALGMAVVFIYFVLGSQFHSFLQPIAIMMTLPLSLIGVLLALAITRTTFNLFAMIGFIMLMGLVVKNGILLVDFANQERREKGSLGRCGAHSSAPDLDDHRRHGVRHAADGARTGGRCRRHDGARDHRRRIEFDNLDFDRRSCDLCDD
jgi:hydrophobic/amphiphilic exporter-1 (mainly G- bacteria), HAE1 family